MYEAFLVVLAIVLLALVAGLGLLAWKLLHFLEAGVAARVGARYPHVALAAAMASEADPELRDEFRKWLRNMVDTKGWQAAEAELTDVLSRRSPTLPASTAPA